MSLDIHLLRVKRYGRRSVVTPLISYVSSRSNGVTIYVLARLQSKVRMSKIVLVSPQPRDKNYAAMIDFNGIVIANVHLCGGRYDDQYYKDYMTTKVDSMKVVLSYGPNIVVGDFNGDLTSPHNYPLYQGLNHKDREDFMQRFIT